MLQLLNKKVLVTLTVGKYIILSPSPGSTGTFYSSGFLSYWISRFFWFIIRSSSSTCSLRGYPSSLSSSGSTSFLGVYSLTR